FSRDWSSDVCSSDLANILRTAAKFENAQQIETDDEEKQRQRTRDPRRLQLETPAHCLARAAQRDQQASKRKECDHYAGEIEQPMSSGFAALQATCELQRLHREHRQHARHDV